MKRQIIRIDEEKCDGCGLCVPGCHEGAIRIVEGKARLLDEAHCDGLGACLGHCPRGALSIEEKEASAFDEKLSEREPTKREPLKSLDPAPSVKPAACACPGSAIRKLEPGACHPKGAKEGDHPPSALEHWPVQLMLVPPSAAFLAGSDLLICADCVPFAVPDFHERYLAGRAIVVGCPKLDDLEHYREKLKAVFKEARPKRITILRMEVPCCGGLAQAALEARALVSPATPLEIHVIGIRGEIHQQETVKK